MIDSDLSTIVPLPERLSVTLTFEPMTFKIPNVPFLTIFVIAVSLTSDLTISISTQFIFVAQCT